ncbi:MAG: TonB-dependent receptor [Bryobacteraceae bacterium]
MRIVLAAILGCAWLPWLAAAELGRLEGTVRDGSQAVVPAALISAIQEETGFQFVAAAHGNGEFHLTVPAGHYNIVVRRVGFRTVSRLSVGVAAGATRKVDFELHPDSVFETITVSDSVTPPAQTGSGGEIVIRPDDFEGLPDSDRTVTGLLREAPGLLFTPANGGEPGQASSLGARPDSNNYLVDGLSANNTVAGGGWPSFLPLASLPAMSALGTTHDLAVLDAIEEVTIDPRGLGAGTSQAAGAVIMVRTKSGTNQFHGSAFGILRPDTFAASDWFADRNGLGGGGNLLTDAGASAGGPLVRGRTFFFAAAEILHLRQDYSWITTVPSTIERLLAPAPLQPFLDQFPLPNGPTLDFGIAELRGSKSYPGGLGAGSVRLDHRLQARTWAFLRAAVTPSWNELGYDQVNLSQYRNTVAAVGVTHEGSRWTHYSRIGFSRAEAETKLLTNPETADFYSAFPSMAADFLSLSVGGAGSISLGQSGSNRQDSIEISHTAALRLGRHQLQAGADYQQLDPLRNGPVAGYTIAFSTYNGPTYGAAAPVWVTQSEVPLDTLRLNQASGFLRDTWNVSARLTVVLGIRANWVDTPPIPAASYLYSVGETGSSMQVGPLAAGAPLWRGSLAPDPSVSLAWRPGLAGDTVFRASWSEIHDNGSQIAATLLNPLPDSALRTVESTSAYFSPMDSVSLGYGFSADLRLPVANRWSASLERELPRHGILQVSYSGMSSANLLRIETALNPSPALPQLAQLLFATSHGMAVYHGLNTVYRRPLAGGLQGQVAYSWSRAIDTGSSDSSLFLIAPGVSAQNDRGDSSFDARQTLTAALSYATPALRPFRGLLKGWNLGTFFYTRTAFPVDVLASESLDGFAIANLRPNLVPGLPVWIPNADAAGGRQLNPAAFAPASAVPGSLGRDAVRGFGMWQADCSAGRSFALYEKLRLSIRAEAYNVFNHPQFADPMPDLSNPMFGQSGSSLNLMMGSGSPTSGQSPAFQMGGPRSLQLSLRLGF